MKQPKTLVPELWLRNGEAVKVFADSLRLKILRLMERPTTVKAVANALQMPVTKLYYHVNLLAQHGLIQVVDQNLESGIVEKVYQLSARQFKLANPICELTVAFPKQTAASPLPESGLSKKGKLYFPPFPEFRPSGVGWRMPLDNSRMRLTLYDQPGGDL